MFKNYSIIIYVTLMFLFKHWKAVLIILGIVYLTKLAGVQQPIINAIKAQLNQVESKGEKR